MDAARSEASRTLPGVFGTTNGYATINTHSDGRRPYHAAEARAPVQARVAAISKAATTWKTSPRSSKRFGGSSRRRAYHEYRQGQCRGGQTKGVGTVEADVGRIAQDQQDTATKTGDADADGVHEREPAQTARALRHQLRRQRRCQVAEGVLRRLDARVSRGRGLQGACHRDRDGIRTHRLVHETRTHPSPWSQGERQVGGGGVHQIRTVGAGRCVTARTVCVCTQAHAPQLEVPDSVRGAWPSARQQRHVVPFGHCYCPVPRSLRASAQLGFPPPRGSAAKPSSDSRDR